MSDQTTALIVEFMSEFYQHVVDKTPVFMTRPAEEVALASMLEGLLVKALAALQGAAGDPTSIAEMMLPLVEAMRTIVVMYTVEGEERDAWVGQLDEFRQYVAEGLANG